MKKQRASASADLDDDNGNLARVLMSNPFQKSMACDVEAFLDSAQEADVAKAFEYDDGPCSSSTNLGTHFDDNDLDEDTDFE